jgi:pumilio family protein 6
LLCCLCVLAFDDQLITVFWQTCVKWCSQSERDAIFDVLHPHLLDLSRKKYAVFLVKKLIELGTFHITLYTNQIMRGHVAMLHDSLI